MPNQRLASWNAADYRSDGVIEMFFTRNRFQKMLLILSGNFEASLRFFCFAVCVPAEMVECNSISTRSAAVFKPTIKKNFLPYFAHHL